VSSADKADSPVRVLIVDDSALMRKLLTDLFKGVAEIEVVGAAGDASSALEMTGKLRPDVITLDIQMPGLSGMEVLPILIATHGVPVIMVSTLTQAGADITLAALELGAVDFFPKPDRHQIAEMKACREVLIEKVMNASKSRVRKPRPSRRTSSSESTAPKVSSPALALPEAPANLPCVVIGISTGGPEALGQILPLISPPIPPILVVQHMPATFTGVFAERLNRNCQVPVKEAAGGDAVVPNQILIAPGGKHMTITGHPPRSVVKISEGPAVSGHRPSIDMLFQSAAKAYGPSTVGIIMTGMGRDGVEGCKRIIAAGGRTFGQDEATSVVYGMNKAAFIEGAVMVQFPVENLPALIEQLSKTAD